MAQSLRIIVSRRGFLALLVAGLLRLLVPRGKREVVAAPADAQAWGFPLAFPAYFPATVPPPRAPTAAHIVQFSALDFIKRIFWRQQ